ncbi:2-deoxy-D-gluconate 3-dehydrogenase 5) [Formosa agariphila KMM 3901]|uniref:2-deoxy-D-gluconate 3-dehydrogenase 5 n=1 Tax=Formosa agariphila (strain DSM 15362 / KCTC 12365 / LMG 23005 / KMM 3901 / M-2Alg 35-1) TaxID=1347342 RepID=T2KMN7_FORAG|nr:SDR family oxidoreductase [Formosa agariphila]CDF80005.1 2-deoxy-D-gluconate 3-dehydrogenase 5) [Formosa agariphila KMM 3901]
MANNILESFSLKGKKAIIVGGAGDLGMAMVEAVSQAGAQSVIIDFDERVFDICENFKNDGLDVSPIKADISNIEEIKDSYAKALDILGGTIDILINSAGIQRRYPSEDFPDEEWQKVMAVNLDAVFYFCKYAGNTMLKNGGGKIINVASIISFLGGITIPAYAASKGGVAQLTKALSNDWSSKGICVNAIAPGYMDTQLNTALINDKIRTEEVFNRVPMKRWGTGDDLKGLTVLLASSASDYMTGCVIPVDGGYLVR